MRSRDLLNTKQGCSLLDQDVPYPIYTLLPFNIILWSISWQMWQFQLRRKGVCLFLTITCFLKALKLHNLLLTLQKWCHYNLRTINHRTWVTWLEITTDRSEISWVRLYVSTRSHDKWRQYLVMSFGQLETASYGKFYCQAVTRAEAAPPRDVVARLNLVPPPPPGLCDIIVNLTPPPSWSDNYHSHLRQSKDYHRRRVDWRH
jgi:hypothetical protein